MSNLHLSPKIRWLVLLSLVAALLIVAPQPTDTVAVKALQKGAQLVTRDTPEQDVFELPSGGRQVSLKDIETTYGGTIARRPYDPQPWRHLGDLYTSWERPKDAAHAYGQAILRGDHTPDLDRSLAQLFATLGDSRLAARYWSAYLIRRPDDRASRLALAWTAIQLADWERAQAELEQLLVDDPNGTVVHAWLGLLLTGTNAEAGVHHLERATVDPAMADLLTPVFTALRLATAVDDPAYRSALLGVAFLDLNVPTLHRQSEMHLGELHRSTEKTLADAVTTLALRSLLAAVHDNPAYADAYAYLGQALDQLGWSDWAQVSLSYSLQLAPQSPVVQTLMGLFWDRHGSPAVARQYFEAAYNQDQDNASLCLEVAATYFAEGEYTAAEVWLHHAAEIAPNDPRIWEALAHYYVDLGIDVEDSGFVAVRRLLEIAENDPRAHDLMGWAYFLTADDNLSRASLEQALALDPESASTYYHLGRLNARQGRYAEAAQNYRRAADHDVGGELAPRLERAWDGLPPAYRDGQ